MQRITYELTTDAKEHLIDIYDYGADTWGDQQAETYFHQLTAHFSAITENPLRYPAVPHIKAGFRRSVFGSHSIYFRIEADRIIIAAILRSQNTTRIR